MCIRYKLLNFFFVLLCINLGFTLQAFPQDNQSSNSKPAPKELKMDRAIMCEEVKDFGASKSGCCFFDKDWKSLLFYLI